jgi:hypothetical protein
VYSPETPPREIRWRIPPLAWLTANLVPDAACWNSPSGCVAARESALAIPVAP